MRHAAVEPGQLRGWVDGSGQPFMILEVDRKKTVWNVKFIKTDGSVVEFHERTIRETSRVISAAG
jgi:hypothetical protein